MSIDTTTATDVQPVPVGPLPTCTPDRRAGAGRPWRANPSAARRCSRKPAATRRRRRTVAATRHQPRLRVSVNAAPRARPTRRRGGVAGLSRADAELHRPPRVRPGQRRGHPAGRDAADSPPRCRADRGVGGKRVDPRDCPQRDHRSLPAGGGPPGAAGRRRGGSWNCPQPAEPEPVPAEARTELAACLEPLLAQLPAIYREALQLTDLDGLTQAAAAAQVGLTTSGMKARVQRGRGQLKALLTDCCEIALDRRGGVIDYRPQTDDCNCQPDTAPTRTTLG